MAKSLDMLGQAQFDLLLTDFHMPVMDGFGLAQGLSGNGKRLTEEIGCPSSP